MIETEKRKVGDWVVNTCLSHVIELPPSVVEQGRNYVEEACRLFPKEDTWVQKNLGIPTIIARIDGVVHGEELECFEVEERPCGIGFGVEWDPEFRAQFAAVRETWPHVEVVAAPDRVNRTDDHLWTTVNGGGDGLVLLRCEPHEEEFHRFEGRSVSTIRAEGDKSYGEAMGLWRQVRRDDELPWDESFVLKPLQGSKFRAVEIWDVNKRRGSSTKSRILRFLEEEGAMFLQKLVEPMTGPAGGFLMIRIFYAFGLRSGRWQYLGGVWVERDNLRIHGASDAITGVVR